VIYDPIALHIIGATPGMMEEILKRILDKVKGADFWIVLCFLVVGIACWRWIGTTESKKKELFHRQISVALVLTASAGTVIVLRRRFFKREPLFTKDRTGILVMRIVGDDELNSLQGDLIASLNASLQKEAVGQQIEVHAGDEALDENSGVAAAHQRARAIGQSLNAQLVTWGRKIGDKKFYSRITVVAAPKGWSAASERTRDVQSITELRLPEEVVDEPFYLIQFAVGYSYYSQDNYKEALPHFRAALRRKGALPNELTDLQFCTAFCHHSLAAGQKNMTANLQEAIALYETAGAVYEATNQQKWALTQNNLGTAYAELPVGNLAANLQKAISAYEAALGVYTEKDLPVDWAMIQNNLGVTYGRLPTGDRSAHLKKAIAAFEAVLRVRSEKDDPLGWATIQHNLGNAYAVLPSGDRAVNFGKAIGAFEAALSVRTETAFPVKWAMTQNSLGNAYTELPTGDRSANFERAIAAYEAALSVRTEKDRPIDWAETQNNLGVAYRSLPSGDRTANMQKAIDAFEGALRVRTENDFPVEWGMVQHNLGLAYHELPIGDRTANLKRSIILYEAALRVRTEKDFPVEWATTKYNLGLVYAGFTDGDRVEHLRSAKLCLEDSLTVYNGSVFPERHRDVAANLAEVEQQLRSLAPK
jgi:tetratricopeptide (TPR) repeat protein